MRRTSSAAREHFGQGWKAKFTDVNFVQKSSDFT
jgi:hypothetical protein